MKDLRAAQVRFFVVSLSDFMRAVAGYYFIAVLISSLPRNGQSLNRIPLFRSASRHGIISLAGRAEKIKRASNENEAERLAEAFLREYAARGEYLRDELARLFALATSEDDTDAEPATRAVFASVVERLADSFSRDGVSLYNRAFAQFIQFCRHTRKGRPLDGELSAFGLNTEQELVARAESLRRVSRLSLSREQKAAVKRVIVLSRVTVGADVAITSVLIGRLKREFPGAEIALVGGRKAAELFGGDERLSFKQIAYDRGGRAIDRLLNWVDLLASVRHLTAGLRRGQYVVVDPDSRLTQLGLLPVTSSPDEYIFFPSREFGSETRASLGQLASRWLDQVFGTPEVTFPQVSPARADLETSRSLVARLSRGGARPCVTINFGVGENPAKRVGDDFEKMMVARLIEGGAAVILDKGVGEDEERRASLAINHAARIEREGRPVRVIEAGEEGLKSLLDRDRLDCDLFVWRGRIGMLAGMIGQSDLYIGYDSAGQHIAAALGVPTIDVFAGFSSPRMVERWHPTGTAEARVVVVDEAGDRLSADEMVGRVIAHARELMSYEL